MPFPFEVAYGDVERNFDGFIDRLFDSLDTEFLVMPKGPGFIEYAVFDTGYEALKAATKGFSS